jgi:hypothetical protein
MIRKIFAIIGAKSKEIGHKLSRCKMKLEKQKAKSKNY